MSKNEVTITEAAGFAGAGVGPLGPVIEAGMHAAAASCHAEGVADDTPHDRLVELVGGERLEALLGGDAADAVGADYIRASKLAARTAVKAGHRARVAAHEAERAAETAGREEPE
jgi:hypothetical protein